jgi:hypothetical protein
VSSMPDAYVDDPDDVSSDKVASVVPNPIFLRWQDRYYDALDIVNNWRSSHNFPLNTFHVGLKRGWSSAEGLVCKSPRCAFLLKPNGRLFHTWRAASLDEVALLVFDRSI